MKHLETILAGVIAASLVAPMAPVMAAVQNEETTDITISIQTTDDFINAFAKYTVITVQWDGTETSESVFYTEVNRDNYATILSGKAVYDTLSEEMRAEIDAIILENTGINYSDMVTSAMNEQAAAEEEARLQAEAEAAAQEEVGPVVEEASSEVQEDASQETVEEAETQTDVQNSSATGVGSIEVQEEVTSKQEVVGPVLTSAVQISEQSLDEEVSADIQYATCGAALFASSESDLMPQADVEETVDSGAIIVEYIDVPETSQEANIYTVSQVVQSSETVVSDESVENKFVETYCSSNGSIYTSVTSDNYLQIISGYEDWQGLTLTQKTSVNSILTKSGSSTYTKLYNAAQALNGNNNTSYGGVHTSVSTNALGYGFMSGISAAALAFILKKRKIK